MFLGIIVTKKKIFPHIVFTAQFPQIEGNFAYFKKLYSLFGEPSSSVSIVSGYGIDDWAIEVRSPAEAKRFFL
jgi:hypothetical protein